ncbi:MAG TPA: 2,3-bisphosphoglycerate-independent phosphoglycerate mutase [Verrucomicrobia bacterium]|nr:MAG: phosphoglycerate mutase (2,3-diphosphoglycerate-independent) [Lentisphaerae bacterium GWF2_57_35]HBA83333.1 2,3-bisphosphoglycerate-independent phosphoglycerate mutase [Verrucomicrobiota bacterium]
MEALKRADDFRGPKGPVVLVIMDGVGIGKYVEGDMVLAANTPNLNWLKEHAVAGQLKAHGKAVGMPSDEDMGNSEIGHNAIGCGRVFDQGASLVSKAIESRSLFEGETWKMLVKNCLEHQSALHFLGLFSDGNVHSHIDHLEAMLKEAKAAGVKKARVHLLLDGRDVPPTSALEYVDRFEAFLKDLNADGTVDFVVASGGGRMKITMDRYEADWSMVKLGWEIHVKGEGRLFASARAAIEAHRAENPGVLDQDLPPFVIARDGKPVGAMADNDSVIFYNFRGDRAIEISRAFEEDAFDKFDRGARPNVLFAGMMQYDGDLKIPKNFLVPPPGIDRTMGEYLAMSGVRQLAVSETQKFGHVTYFFNGNRSGKFNEKLEDYIEVPSDRIAFEFRPWMKAGEVTDKVLQGIERKRNKYGFIRVNFANGDMVGHTGVCPAVRIAVESVDLCLGRIMKAVKAAEGILVVSADHGNADDMYEHNKKTGEVSLDSVTGEPKTKTSHSLNPVPVCVYDPSGKANLRLTAKTDLGISSLAATCIKLLGFEPPADYDPSVVDVG